MKTAKLLICYHKPDILLKDEIMTPIHVGRANAKKDMEPDDPKLKWLLDNMIGDDTGENISLLNRTYNELTALYWAWKNYDKLGDPDYIGLMHYRRHFVFNEGEIKVYEIPDMESEHYFEALNYSPEKLIKDLEDCDFACHLGRVDGIYKHYLANHRIEDMELALKILKEKYPKYAKYADEYMGQDVGNFCNMFIFPKKMFFEYCKYIFDILEEFRRRADISEKRFFVSERLTGIFIYEKMKEGLKYKVYPINFVCEKINIPIVYPINKDNLFATEVSIVSALERAKKGTSFTFYLMHGGDITDKDKQKLNKLTELYDICRIEFISSDLEQKYYPLEISERLPNVKKLIYFNEKTIAMHDLGEFYRTCSVDDYYISGLPEDVATNVSADRKLSNDIFVINADRFRKHEIYDKAKPFISGGKSPENILNLLCEDQIGYFAEWFITGAGKVKEYDLPIFSKLKNRGQYQLEATWRPVLYFGENEPWANIQGVYSNFWWNYAAKAPLLFKFPHVDINSAVTQLDEQQKELNRIGEINRKMREDDLIIPLSVPNVDPLTVYVDNDHAAEAEKLIVSKEKAADKAVEITNETVKNKYIAIGTEEYGNLSAFGKAKIYLKTYGFKLTVRRATEKLFGKKN